MQAFFQIPFFRLLFVLLLCLQPFSARAASLIRDPDIEQALHRLATPVLVAAGLNPGRIQILLINDKSMNAFVIDQNHIFIHTGLMLRMKSAAQIQGVIAHEAAHIANGHITQRIVLADGISAVAGIGMILGVAIAASTGRPDAGAAVAAGVASSAQRSFLTHTRAEEASADQSGFRYTASAGVDPAAMIEVLNLFKGQEVLGTSRQDAYVRSHPLTSQRLRAARGFAAAYGGNVKDSREADYWFARAKSKLAAFLQNPQAERRKLKASDTGEIAQMVRAITYHRQADANKALSAMNSVLAARPNDPYYRELQAQILMESRQFDAALGAYAMALNGAPRNAIIMAGYGRALLAAGGSENEAKALNVLIKARALDGQDPRLLRDLAVAYAKAKQPGMASLVTAERFALDGKFKDAAIHAKRAADQLPHGSTGARQAQDILYTAERLDKKGKKRN
ncbi:M48 family metalloprotease [Falsihalocynthiibacter sp. S25ZX9]|uniref:M48 family metalloprotease n=1 Tax=Falsihalocynthiibacter sp. S25ZX9 TaxID=3240870 RepID=UPI00350F95BD